MRRRANDLISESLASLGDLDESLALHEAEKRARLAELQRKFLEAPVVEAEAQEVEDEQGSPH